MRDARTHQTATQDADFVNFHFFALSDSLKSQGLKSEVKNKSARPLTSDFRP
jgi:hypothetical protein